MPGGAPRLLDVGSAAGLIHCRIDGREGAPWLVFSNSHGTDLSMWDDQVLALADRFRILRYDQRGHGGTLPIDGPCDFDGLAADVVAVMDAAGAQRATLIGISMGAVTMLRAAALYPTRANAVVAADGQWRSPPTGQAAWQKRIDLVRSKGVAAIADKTAQRWLSADVAARDLRLFARVRDMVAATSVDGYVACARALQRYDFSTDYPRLAMPVLYVVGADDGVMPVAMQAMAEATPDSRLVVIPSAGHLPCFDQPERFQQALDDFLNELGGRYAVA
jgi:3-oxoadipate enol-lactonase